MSRLGRGKFSWGETFMISHHNSCIIFPTPPLWRHISWVMKGMCVAASTLSDYWETLPQSAFYWDNNQQRHLVRLQSHRPLPLQKIRASGQPFSQAQSSQPAQRCKIKFCANAALVSTAPPPMLSPERGREGGRVDQVLMVVMHFPPLYLKLLKSNITFYFLTEFAIHLSLPPQECKCVSCPSQTLGSGGICCVWCHSTAAFHRRRWIS